MSRELGELAIIEVNMVNLGHRTALPHRFIPKKALFSQPPIGSITMATFLLFYTPFIHTLSPLLLFIPLKSGVVV